MLLASSLVMNNNDLLIYEGHDQVKRPKVIGREVTLCLRHLQVICYDTFFLNFLKYRFPHP